MNDELLGPSREQVAAPVRGVVASSEEGVILKLNTIALKSCLQCLGLLGKGVVVHQEPSKLRDCKDLAVCALNVHVLV